MLNVPEQRRPVVPTRPSNMSGHSNPRQPAHVRQSAMSDHSNARPANMPNHHNARLKPTDFDLTVRQTTRRRLAEKTLYMCYRKNDQGKMVWMPYPQKDIDNINANLSTGPVEVEFGQNKFKIGLVQRGMSGKGRGCTRPVRMMEDGTFEVD